jgi:glycosyltransferase involved in cell wall biosynthesis
MKAALESYPLVSIVIPVKNGLPYLVECIQSVLDTNYPNLEVIISDDGSVDGSSEYLHSLELDQVSIIQPEGPLMIGDHWTFASLHATGKYVKLLCSDDTVAKNGIHNQVSILEANKAVTMISSKRKIINRKSYTLISSLGSTRKEMILSGRPALRKTFMSGTNIFGEPSSIMFRREPFLQSLPWSDERPYLLDLDFYTKLLLLPKSQVFFSPSVDATFRIHGSSLSSRIQKEHTKHFVDFVLLYKDHLNLGKFDLSMIKFKARYKTKIRTLIFFLAGK